MSSFPIAPYVRLYLGKPRAPQCLAFQEWQRDERGVHHMVFPKSAHREIASRWGFECCGVFVGVTVHRKRPIK